MNGQQTVSELRKELANLTIKILDAEALKKADAEAHKETLKILKAELEEVADMYREETSVRDTIEFRNAK